MNAAVIKDKGLPQKKGLEGGQYKPLTDTQIEQIHEASLAILDRTGVEVESSDVRNIFKLAGARIEGSRVRFSASMIERAIESAPSRVLLAGRDRKHDLNLEGKRVYVGTGGAALQVLDFETGYVRRARMSDVANAARLVDILNNIHFCFPIRSKYPIYCKTHYDWVNYPKHYYPFWCYNFCSPKKNQD